MTESISWQLSRVEDQPAVESLIDGTSLVTLVTEYEASRGFDVVGGYAGLVLGSFQAGDLRRYVTGERFLEPGRRVPLLGCDCGNWGCWPLLARVTFEAGTVTWADFEQPHRPTRDYTGFGPFRFDEQAYGRALESMDTGAP